jgi:hypothetical protein
MNFRAAEYKELGIEARWLEPEKAKNAYEYALQFSDKTRYGLSQDNVTGIEQLIIVSDSIADAWISSRFRKDGTVQIVYGDDEVGVLSAADFVSHWRSIFVPSRDDAIILHNSNKSILFYCHEDELEHGMRAA